MNSTHQRQITADMRRKYALRPYGDGIFSRRPAGGNDVILLCNTIDVMANVIDGLFAMTSPEQQQTYVDYIASKFKPPSK